MQFEFGKYKLESFSIEGPAYGVQHSSQVVPEQRYSPGTGSFIVATKDEKTTYWVKDRDGRERHVSFSAPVPARDGHRLTAVYVGRVGSGTGVPVALFNANTKSITLHSSEQIHRWLEFPADSPAGCLASILAGLSVPLAPLVTYLLFPEGREEIRWLAFAAAVISLGLMMTYMRNWRQRSLRRLGQMLLEQIAHETALAYPFPPDVQVSIVT